MAGELLRASADQIAFRDELLARGLFIDSGVAGVYGRSGAFERIRAGVDALISAAAAAERPETMHFPPLLPRRQLESSGYLHSFPHLAGSVFAFAGSEADAVQQDLRASAHEDWSEFQQMSELALVPAACYPVYPALACRGAVASAGITVDAGGAWVFRHEPAEDPARLQLFHQRELVRIGEPGAVLGWRDGWRERGLELLGSIGLDVKSERAADPFFGRGGRMLAINQRAQELKYELAVQIAGPEPTAVASFNYHQDHFAAKYGLQLAGGEPAHTACLGFGQERIVLALLRTHGFEPADWPPEVRRRLWGE